MLPDIDITYSPDAAAGGGAVKEAPPFAELPAPLQAAFNRLTDDAGWAPPALTDPTEVVTNYADYRKGPHRQMLNRLVQRAVYISQETQLPTTDLFVLHQNERLIPQGEQWPVSALFSTDPLANQEQFAQGESNLTVFSTMLGDKVVIDTIEAPAQSVESVDYIVNKFASRERRVYIEVPIGEQTNAIMEAIARHKDKGVFAKLRTGGPNPPTFEQTADFMIQAAYLNLGYKLTGRLHGLVAHTAIEKDGREVEESGYLNVVLASALAQRLAIRDRYLDEVWRKPAASDVTKSDIVKLLQEKDINAFEISETGIKYKRHLISTDEIKQARTNNLHSIGSCSFEEPVDELKKLPQAA